MSDEVKRYSVRGQFDPGLDLMTTREVVLASDYTAIEAKCEKLREALNRIRDHAARIMDDEVFYEADSALSASTGQEVKP